MNVAWLIIFTLLWTGALAGTASLITSGRVHARFGQLVWRGAAILSIAPLAALFAARFLPDRLPGALPDIPYVEPAAGAVSGATQSLQAAVSGPQWAWTAPALLAVIILGWAVRFGAAALAQLRLQRLKSRSVAHRRNIDAFPLTELGLERVPPVRLIPDGSPFIAGLSHRVIYVPEGLEGQHDLRQIAIHECVHLKRGDLVTRPLERLIGDLFWFSPFAWMMRRELDFWREAVCDEIASSLSGDRIGYARTLAQAARVSAPARALPVAAFILPRKRSLPMRLNRLLEHRPATSRPVTALCVSLAALALSPLALAQAGETGDVQGAEKDGEARFGHAVILSPEAKLTSSFGERPDPFTKEKKWHSGTDIAAPEGTPVHTPGCGVVVFSGNKGGYGEVIEIAYPDGTKMRFGQLSKRLVEKGDEVNVGSVIGKVGKSGRATGPHLHLEYWSPAIDEATGEKKFKPSDPQTAESLVLFAAG